MGFLKYNKNLIPYARELRKQLTPTELHLWLLIRNKQILSVPFYRQKVIGKYIVDFFAPSVKLVLEVDGSQHYEPEAIEQDLSRDTYLRELGLSVLRFDNQQVRSSVESVLHTIYEYIENYLKIKDS